MSIVDATVTKDLFIAEISLLGLYPSFQILNYLMDEVPKRTDLIKASMEKALKESEKYQEAFKPK